MAETRPIPSAPGYFATSDGKIIGKRGRPLSPSPQGGGYLHVTVHIDGKQLTPTLHVLVCEAFHGRRPSPKHEAAHWDGVRVNCPAENLRWATRKENREDMMRHGTWPAGEKHGRAQITSEIASQIRNAHAAALVDQRARKGLRAALAKKFGVKESLVKDVIAGRSWKTPDA